MFVGSADACVHQAFEYMPEERLGCITGSRVSIESSETSVCVGRSVVSDALQPHGL